MISLQHYETGFVNKSNPLCETLEKKKQFSIENFNKDKTIAISKIPYENYQ